MKGTLVPLSFLPTRASYRTKRSRLKRAVLSCKFGLQVSLNSRNHGTRHGNHAAGACMEGREANGSGQSVIRAVFKTLGGWVVVRSQQTSNGSFSAVSKPIFASKHSLESSRRDLQDLHTSAPLRLQNVSKHASNFLLLHT